MFGWVNKRKIRRQQVREHRAKSVEADRALWVARLFSWPVMASAMFIVCVSAVALLGDAGIGYGIGQRIDSPIYAVVSFEVKDPQKTAAAREAARARTPSYYVFTDPALTFDRIRAELRRLYQTAADADSFEAFHEAAAAEEWPVDEAAYRRLRALVNLPKNAGHKQFDQWVDSLPLERQHVVRDLTREPRMPPSSTGRVILQTTKKDGTSVDVEIPHAQLVLQGNQNALRGIAHEVARSIPQTAYELREIVEGVVLATLHETPTIVYDQERTDAEMIAAEEATPVALTSFAKNKPFIPPGLIGHDEYSLLEAHHAAYLDFLRKDDPEAHALRFERGLQKLGLVTLVVLLSVGLMVYVRLHQPRVFDSPSRTMAFLGLALATVLAVRLVVLRWPDLPTLQLGPCLFTAGVLAIVYPQRFAMGAMCTIALIAALTARDNVVTVVLLFSGAVVTIIQLDEIRTRTKVIATGAITSLVVVVASAAGGFYESQPWSLVSIHALTAGTVTLITAFVISGVLPFVERAFRIATSLTLLEWRDPTKRLLQLLAREAPGTYNHSLVLGTLAEAACSEIGANGLLAQVGALYHDIGKINKADYFTENQSGGQSRHANLAPTMSLLIILGHVKDGVEMAKEYKLPSVLRQFIAQHHGTTVVRYFHHMASEKQPHVASGKHDREIPESEFRYPGPKPRTKESAVLMFCDSVESAVRSLPEPTPGRIETVVHRILTERLNDGQLDDCDITLREVRLVEGSLVKTLCSIYHGRVPYPAVQKEAKGAESRPEPKRA